jgi:signal transduction histidine kinase
MTWRSPRLLRTSVPWRGWLYVATGAPLGLVTLAVTLVLTGLGVLLSPVAVGLAMLVSVGLAGLPVGAVERRRLRLLGDAVAESPHRPLPGVDVRSWLRTRLRETVTWRELGYTMLLATGLWPLDYVTAAVPLVLLVFVASPLLYALFAGPGGLVVLGVDLPTLGSALISAAVAAPLLALSAYLVAAVSALHAALARMLLVDKETDDRVMELVRSSGRMLDAFDAERQRIERDLHDGTQQRLVALAVMLDMARMRAGDTPELAEMLTRAHGEATTTLAELRELVQGIHPHVLTERGLPAAVAELVTRSPLAVDVRMRIAGRLPPAVESTAFFAVSEALSNIAKHADADRAWVDGRTNGSVLTVEIGDTGRGGVDPAKGSGVRGLADRVAAVGGRVRLSSPHGGPTVLCVEIPCVPEGR